MEEKVALYEGEDSYIFVSYCHKDKDKVFPVIGELMRKGFRVWYDQGIHPGSEWPEIVAEHLDRCTVFMVFISDNYIQSQNCIREIHFSVARNKKLISVMLEPVRLTPGVEMQLCVSQAIRYYDFNREEKFYEELFTSTVLEECRESRTDSVPKKLPSSQKKKKEKKKSGKKKKSKAKAIAASVALLLLLGAGGTAFWKMWDTVVISGTEYSRGDRAVTVSDETVTSETLQELKKFRTLTSLRFDSCKFEAGAEEELAAFAELTRLDMNSCSGIEGYGFLDPLTDLSFLRVADCGLEDDSIRFSEPREELTGLDLSGNPELTDISWVENLPNLYSLTLEGDGISDASAIAGLVKLSTLSLADNEIRDLSEPFQSLRLSYLDLSGNRIESFSGLSDLTVLIEVDLSGNGCDIPLDFIEKSAGTLTHVDLSQNGFTQSQAEEMLGGCVLLQEVRLDDNPLSGSLEFLEGNTELTLVSAKNCGLTGVSGLADAINLRTVELAENPLASLQGFPAIETQDPVTLNLNGSGLESLAGLPENVEYASLLLYENNLQAEEMNEKFALLKGRQIGISYTEGLEPEAVQEFGSCYVDGVPNDQKVLWEEALGYKCNFERLSAEAE